MKKTFKGIAASLLATGALFICISMTTKLNNSLMPISDYEPVVIAKNNTLAKTPADIENLVKGLNIDIRNSAYLILQRVKEKKSYQWGETTNDQIAHFAHYTIIEPTNQDPAIFNLAIDDMNDCIAVNGEDSNCWDYLYQGGSTWKTRVIDRILTSEKLQNTLYNWIFPELVRVVDGFDANEKSYLKSTLNHMIDYTSSYNHKKEKDFYNLCLANDNSDLFTCVYKIVDISQGAYDYTDVANPYRRLETWVYRRVEEGSMTADQINTWLKKLKKDLGI